MLLSQSVIENIIVHNVGNKGLGENLKASKNPLQSGDDIKDLLSRYFLNPFKNAVFNHFHHPSELSLNEVYAFASQVFADPSAFFIQSINIAKHLYEQSTHPNIKPGEFYVVYFSGCIVDDEEVDALGLFKSENKDTYLRVFPDGDGYGINSDNGININRLDKGCLIFNAEKDKGYKVCVVDNTNKGEEARYWKDDFLQIKPRNDSYHYTQNYLDMCRTFVTDQLPEQFEVSKTDQIDLLNRSVNFFKKKEQFDFNEFTNEVIQQPEIIDSFKDFRKQFEAEREMPIVDEFDISAPAVKKQARVFKSVLKLDKNFHIYIHGNRELIEQGVDETTGMKFYKIYYREEA